METIDINQKINWDKKYEIGIDRIDLEHKLFLELINSYRNAIRLNYNEEELNGIILEIEKYAEFHFISEENFMKKIEYPGYEKHKLIHFNLLEKLNISKHRIDNHTDFLQFALDWFIHHTAIEDRHILDFLNKNKIEIDFDYSFELLDKN